MARRKGQCIEMVTEARDGVGRKETSPAVPLAIWTVSSNIKWDIPIVLRPYPHICQSFLVVISSLIDSLHSLFCALKMPHTCRSCTNAVVNAYR